jgi:hypothetical protein
MWKIYGLNSNFSWNSISGIWEIRFLSLFSSIPNAVQSSVKFESAHDRRITEYLYLQDFVQV